MHFPLGVQNQTSIEQTGLFRSKRSSRPKYVTSGKKSNQERKMSHTKHQPRFPDPNCVELMDLIIDSGFTIHHCWHLRQHKLCNQKLNLNLWLPVNPEVSTPSAYSEGNAETQEKQAGRSERPRDLIQHRKASCQPILTHTILYSTSCGAKTSQLDLNAWWTKSANNNCLLLALSGKWKRSFFFFPLVEDQHQQSSLHFRVSLCILNFGQQIIINTHISIIDAQGNYSWPPLPCNWFQSRDTEIPILPRLTEISYLKAEEGRVNPLKQDISLSVNREGVVNVDHVPYNNSWGGEVAQATSLKFLEYLKMQLILRKES